MNRPREGNVPGLPLERETDPPDSLHSLERKVESGLAEPQRDSMRNRLLASLNGWSQSEYQHWVLTGELPEDRPVVLPEIDENTSERLKR